MQCANPSPWRPFPKRASGARLMIA